MQARARLLAVMTLTGLILGTTLARAATKTQIPPRAVEPSTTDLPNACDDLLLRPVTSDTDTALSVFEKRLHAPVTPTDIQALGEELGRSQEVLDQTMNDLGITDPEERQMYATSVKIRPILATGILYQAIVEALRDRGVTRWRDIRSLLRAFPLLDVKEKRGLVEGTIDILHLALIEFSQALTIAQSTQLRTRAAQLGMSEEEFSLFLLQWKQQGASDYSEIRLALLDALLTCSSRFLAEIHQAHTQTHGWKSWFSFSSKKSALITAERPREYNGYTFQDLERLHPITRTHILTQFPTRLLTPDLELLESVHPEYFRALRPSARARIEERLREYRRSTERHRLKAQIAEKKEEIQRVQQEIYRRISLPPLPITTHANVQLVLEQITLVARTSQFGIDAVNEIRNILDKYGPQLESDELLRVTLRAAKLCVQANSPPEFRRHRISHILTFLQNLRQTPEQFRLSPEDLLQILQALISSLNFYWNDSALPPSRYSEHILNGDMNAQDFKSTVDQILSYAQAQGFDSRQEKIIKRDIQTLIQSSGVSETNAVSVLQKITSEWPQQKLSPEEQADHDRRIAEKKALLEGELQELQRRLTALE